MVDHGALAGSGGYHSPCCATCAFRSSLTMPGSTTVIRLSASTSFAAFIRDRSSTTQPSTAFAPPDRPVPAPRGTTGTPRSAQTRTAWATSPSLRARSATDAFPTCAHSASSPESEATTSASVTSRSSGISRPSASSRLIAGPRLAARSVLSPHDAHVAHGAAVEGSEGLLVGRAVVRGRRSLDRVELDQHGAGRLAGLVGLLRGATGQEGPT